MLWYQDYSKGCNDEAKWFFWNVYPWLNTIRENTISPFPWFDHYILQWTHVIMPFVVIDTQYLPCHYCDSVGWIPTTPMASRAPHINSYFTKLRRHLKWSKSDRTTAKAAIDSAITFSSGSQLSLPCSNSTSSIASNPITCYIQEHAK